MTIVRKMELTTVLFGAMCLSLHAQNIDGTWVKKADASGGPGMTMTIESCCHGGHRLTYSIAGSPMTMIVDSPFDGTDVPVMMQGKASGQTMGIKRVDDHHTYTVLKVNGKTYGTSKATLSADGKTINIEDEFTSNEGGRMPGKATEVWNKK